MSKRFTLLLIIAAVFCGHIPASFAHAASADRIAVEARVRAEMTKDLALPWRPDEGLAGRVCLDGRAVKDFPGDVVEYWANLECPYCGIREPMSAQRQNADVCIVVRHTPSREYGESLKPKFRSKLAYTAGTLMNTCFAKCVFANN